MADKDDWVEIDSGADDWEEVMPSPPKPSPWESGIRGAAQGLSMGFADEITGAAESLFSDKSYEQARDESRANYKAAQEENPIMYGTTEIVGGGLSSAYIPGLNIAKGANLAKTVAQSAALGGATSLGHSDADLTSGDPYDYLKAGLETGAGAALGGGLGFGAQKASPYLEKGVQKVSDVTGDIAERFASRALGAERGTIKKLGIDKVRQAGRQALDEKVLSPFASTDDLIARNKAIGKRGGQMMGDVYEAIDSAGASTFNPLDVASKVDDELGGFYRSPINRGETNQLENTLESILMRGEGNIPIKEAQALKQELSKVANWKNNLNISDKEKMAREAYGIVSSAIDEAVEKGAPSVGGADLVSTLQQGKKLYSNAMTADELLGNKLAREDGNKLLGLTDWEVLGAGGAASMLTSGAAAAPTGIFLGAKKGLERYGSQNAALTLDKISKALQKSPQMAELYKSKPQVFNSMVQTLADRMPSLPNVADEKDNFKPQEQNAILEKTRGTRFQSALQDAAQRGEKAFGATHFLLQSRDPEYRKLTTGGANE